METKTNWAKVRKAIKARNLKVKDLAEKIGIHPNSLSSAINGNRVLGESARILLFQELNMLEAPSDRAS